MNITTKFKPQDEIFYLKDGKIAEDIIHTINVNVNCFSVIEIEYQLEKKVERGTIYSQKDLFESKEALIASLLGNELINEQQDFVCLNVLFEYINKGVENGENQFILSKDTSDKTGTRFFIGPLDKIGEIIPINFTCK